MRSSRALPRHMRGCFDFITRTPEKPRGCEIVSLVRGVGLRVELGAVVLAR